MTLNDDLPVLRVNYSEPHQTVFIHSDQTSASDLSQYYEQSEEKQATTHLLLEEALGIEMIVVTAVSPQPLLDIHH